MTIATARGMTVTGIWLLALLAATVLRANTPPAAMFGSKQTFESDDWLSACDNPGTSECEGALLDVIENEGARSKALLAYYYDNGILIEQDTDKALKWYTRAANEGDADAQKILGQKYELGTDVAQDYPKAIYWYTLAAMKGHAGAQNNLGRMYALGLGVEQDHAIALSWLHKSAAQGNAEAKNTLGTIYDQGIGVPEDDREAVRWFRAAAEQQLPKAQYNLGLMYLNGNGIAQDESEALAWFRSAAENGLDEAQFFLAKMYQFGRATSQNDSESIKWYRLAAEQGHVESQSALGYMLLSGSDVDKNAQEAEGWLSKAAKSGNAGAQYNLGRIHVDRGEFQDAVQYYTLAVQNDPTMVKASFNLGLLYELGLGVQQDNSQARSWYQKAAALGHEKSKTKLGTLASSGPSSRTITESPDTQLSTSSGNQGQEHFALYQLSASPDADSRNNLVVVGNLANVSENEQVLPWIQLHLFNKEGDLLLEKQYSPYEYLPSDVVFTVGAGTQRDVELRAPDPGPDATNFTVSFRNFDKSSRLVHLSTALNPPDYICQAEKVTGFSAKSEWDYSRFEPISYVIRKLNEEQRKVYPDETHGVFQLDQDMPDQVCTLGSDGALSCVSPLGSFQLNGKTGRFIGFWAGTYLWQAELMDSYIAIGECVGI